MSIQPQQVDKIDYSAFLSQAGWQGASIVPLSADMGLRRYYRLELDGKQAFLMDMSRSGILEIGLSSFVAVGEYLTAQGVRCPEIYYHDVESGLSVIEDLGAVSFGDAVAQGEDKAALYRLATEVLIKIRDGASDKELQCGTYEESLIRDRLKQFVDFYMPAVVPDFQPSEAVHEEFQNVLAEMEAALPPRPVTLCHADYHLENLIWRPDTLEQYGLIDFQDAFWGPAPYDLLNLLEDARQTVPEAIKTEMKALYCAGMSAEEKQAFEEWYVVMSAHFHCRILGLFIKFPTENKTEEFLEHIPRVQGYVRENIDNPALAPLKRFIETHNVSLDAAPDLSVFD